MHFTVVLYGCRVDLSRLTYPDSISRCEAALRAAKQYPDAKIILGMSYSTPNQPGLAKATIEWLIKKGWPSEQIIVNPKGHDTLSETKAIIEVLDHYDTKKIIIATSWYHIPRVWLIWCLLYRGKGHYNFSVSWTITSLWSLVREIGAIPKSLISIVCDYFRNKKSR